MTRLGEDAWRTAREATTTSPALAAPATFGYVSVGFPFLVLHYRIRPKEEGSTG